MRSPWVASGLEHFLQAGQRPVVAEVRLADARQAVLVIGPLPDHAAGGEHDVAHEVHHVQLVAEIRQPLADRGRTRADVEHAVQLARAQGLGGLGVLAGLEPLVGVREPALGQEHGDEALHEPRGDHDGRDADLAVLVRAQEQDALAVVPRGHELAHQPRQGQPLFVVFIAQFRVQARTQEHGQPPVRERAVDLLLVAQGDHEADLLGRGVLARVDGVFEVVLGEEMQKPGVKRGGTSVTQRPGRGEVGVGYHDALRDALQVDWRAHYKENAGT